MERPKSSVRRLRSMDKQRKNDFIFPRRGELVVATVKKIVGHGAYLKIEDYNIDGYLPLNEVSTKWVRNIEDVIKEGQKIVVKVIRIDRFTKSVDVSYKDVSESEKNRILRIWKKNYRGLKILEELAKHIEKEKGVKIDLEEKLSPILDKENTVYDALEKIMLEPTLLDKVSLKDLKEDILEYLGKKIHLKKYMYEAVIGVQSIERGGLFRIKESLRQIDENIRKAVGRENVEISLIGSPRYRLSTWSYKPETIKKKVLPTIKKTVEELSKQKGLRIAIIEEKLKVAT